VDRTEDRDLVVDGTDRLRVEGDAERRVLGDDSAVVGGAATIEAGEIVLRAKQRIVLEAGGNRLLIDGSGIEIEARGGSVSVTGADEVLTDAPLVRATGARIEINGQAEVIVKGAIVRLN
jgi:uncharacterized protein (DUF2345 family)